MYQKALTFKGLSGRETRPLSVISASRERNGSRELT